MEKVKVLIVNGVEAAVFRDLPDVRVAGGFYTMVDEIELDEDGKISLQDYLVNVVLDNLDFDGVYAKYDYHIEERKIKKGEKNE